MKAYFKNEDGKLYKANIKGEYNPSSRRHYNKIASAMRKEGATSAVMIVVK